MPRHNPGDYIKAFFTSIKMTARGEKPQSLRAEAENALLFDWFRQTVSLVTSIENAAKARNIDPQTIVFRLDSRETSLKTVLDSVRFHAAQEYPMLIYQRSPYAAMAIQATNLNDRYALLRVSELSSLPDATLEQVKALTDHLEQLPKA